MRGGRRTRRRTTRKRRRRRTRRRKITTTPGADRDAWCTFRRRLDLGPIWPPPGFKNLGFPTGIRALLTLLGLIDRVKSFVPYLSASARASVRVSKGLRRAPRERHQQGEVWCIFPFHPLWLSAGLSHIAQEFSNEAFAQDLVQSAWNLRGKTLGIRIGWKNALPYMKDLVCR